MKLPANSTEIFNIVIVGAWNTAIFSPQWAKENLADDQEKEVILAIPAQLNMAPSRLTVDDVNIYPSAFTVMFDCVSFSEEAIENCVEKVMKICTLLPHTPVNGLGVNFKFIVENDEDAAISNLFNFDDAIRINSDKYVGLGSAIKRNFGHKDGIYLNLTIDKVSQGYQVEFNFHSDAKKLNQVEECLKRLPPKALREEAIEFMKNVYNVELSGSEDNE